MSDDEISPKPHLVRIGAADAEVLIHILYKGQALCGRKGVPSEWRKGEAPGEPVELWISVVDDMPTVDGFGRHVTGCAECIAAKPHVPRPSR